MALQSISIAALKTLAKQFPMIGVPIEFLETMADSTEKRELLRRLGTLEDQVKALKGSGTGQSSAVAQQITQEVNRIVLAASAHARTKHFRIYLTNDARVWASDAILDDYCRSAVREQVRIMATKLQCYCKGATIIVDEDIPGPDLDLVELYVGYGTCSRFDRSNLSQSDEERTHRVIKAAIEEAAYAMSIQVGWPCTSGPFDDKFQPISMKRTIEDGRIWQYDILTNGWLGNVNYDRISNDLEFVIRKPTRSIVNYAAYMLRNVHTGPKPADLSGQFIFFERIYG